MNSYKELIFMMLMGRCVDLDAYDITKEQYIELIKEYINLQEVQVDSKRCTYIIRDKITYRYRNMMFGYGMIAFTEELNHESSPIL